MAKRTLHFAVGGGSRVGKTALTIAFVANCFAEDYEPTITEPNRKEVKIDGVSYVVDVLDSAEWCRCCDCGLVCFAVSSESSFNEVASHVAAMKRINSTMLLALVATKIDLRASSETCISAQRGEELCRDLGMDMYAETSSMTAQGVDDVFMRAGAMIIKASETPHANDASDASARPKCVIG